MQIPRGVPWGVVMAKIDSCIICGLKLCKQDGIMKMRLTTNIDAYPLRLALLFERA